MIVSELSTSCAALRSIEVKYQQLTPLTVDTPHDKSTPCAGKLTLIMITFETTYAILHATN